MKSLTDLNFDQIENFIEYEDYHSKSYFNALVKHLVNLADFLDNNADYKKSYLENLKDNLVNEASVDM